jgi:hypothetical protein
MARGRRPFFAQSRSRSSKIAYKIPLIWVNFEITGKLHRRQFHLSDRFDGPRFEQPRPLASQQDALDKIGTRTTRLVGRAADPVASTDCGRRRRQR